MTLDGFRVTVTGGTGSLGHRLVARLLSGEMGEPECVTVFSRDEAKQHEMRLAYQKLPDATDDATYGSVGKRLRFVIGDVRNYASVAAMLQGTDVVFNAAALKQVPTCEYFPFEAVQTNVCGPQNIVRAIQENDLRVKVVVGISTDKAVAPINVMGMTKAIQERIFITANLRCPQTRFVCVRYGNVLNSRGSVIPLFHSQIAGGGPLTLTTEDMTRFLLTLDDAVDTIFTALREAKVGETYVPRAPSARIRDLADALIGDRNLGVKVTGIRPGEKVHEILVSEEERHRCIVRRGYSVIKPILPELCDTTCEKMTGAAYSSADNVLDREALCELLDKHGLRSPEEQEPAA